MAKVRLSLPPLGSQSTMVDAVVAAMRPADPLCGLVQPASPARRGGFVDGFRAISSTRQINPEPRVLGRSGLGVCGISTGLR